MPPDPTLPPPPTANFLPDPDRHWAQVAKIENFRHDSFREVPVQNGVTKIVGTLIVGGDEDVYGYHFDADKFTQGDVQTWLGRRRLSPVNMNPATRTLWPYTTAGASIAIPAPLTIKAAGSKPPQCSIVAYTGGVMTVEGFGSVCIDLKGLAIAGTTHLLANHSNELGSIVGTGTGTIRGGQLLVDGPLVTTGQAAAQVVELARSGVALSAVSAWSPSNPARHARRNDQRQRPHDHGRRSRLYSGGERPAQRSFNPPHRADSETTVSIAAKFSGVKSRMNAEPQTAENSCGSLP